MNKKIIAIAIASAMAAPVAMADIKVSGRMAGELVSTDSTTPSSTTMQDTGMARIYFDATMGNAFAQMGYKSGFAGDLGAPADLREQYLGYKFDGFDIRAGRVQGVMYTLEGDKYKGTFLQMTGKGGRASFNDGFVNQYVQLQTKVGGGLLKVNYNPTSDVPTYDHDDNDATPNIVGHGGNMGVSWKGKIGGVGVFAGYNNGEASEVAGGPSQSSMKIGASMKFGAVTGTVMLSNKDTGNSTTEADGILLMADMGLGNGLSVNVGYGTTEAGPSAGDTTQTRIAIAKQISKGVKVFGGMTSTDTEGGTDKSSTGVAMEVRF
jgi:hypothetical protein